MFYQSVLPSPLGDLVAIANETHLLLLEFADSKELEKKLASFDCVITKEIFAGWHLILEKVELQLGEYFSGKRKLFSLPLAPTGTDFQKKSWEALSRIPYGETRSYKEEAVLAWNPKAVRAIGGANNKNPIVIIIPCHRVIWADGNLVGYGGGMERKMWLLENENKMRI